MDRSGAGLYVRMDYMYILLHYMQQWTTDDYEARCVHTVRLPHMSPSGPARAVVAPDDRIDDTSASSAAVPVESGARGLSGTRESAGEKRAGEPEKCLNRA